MKINVRLAVIAFLIVSLSVMTFSLTGCASSRNQQSSDKQTMYDFVGGAKPEFNGKKY